MLHERADRKHLRLVTDFDPEVPPVVADQRTVKQMVINLVGNAIKFSRTPSDIRISTRLTDSGEVAIAVADRGIGVAAADIPRILQPFGQVESVINRHEQEGTGLGLYLVKQLIELHGGRIEFRSEPGRGSTVTLFLPAGRRVDAAAQ
jgi:signal transduction histidine kinase